MAHMKIMQITGPGTYRIDQQPIPQPKDHEILVQIEIVTTCPRWDINMMDGRDMFDYGKSPNYPLQPGQPGHEAAGTVKAVGSAVRGFAVGDRVAALEHLHGTGAYAQYICYQEHEIIKLPEAVSFKQAAPIELLKCVAIGMLQFGDLRGRSIVISGLGPAGLLAIQLARIWGAKEVTGIDISEERVAYVNRLGLGNALLATEAAGRTFDLGYDCVGAAASVQNLLRLASRKVVIFGVLRGTVQYEEHLWLKGTTLESYQGRPVDARLRELLIDALTHKGLNTECLLTHHVPFTRYEEAVALLKSQQAIKIYFYPQTDMDAAGGVS